MKKEKLFAPFLMLFAGAVFVILLNPRFMLLIPVALVGLW